jgi:hypothetical protein
VNAAGLEACACVEAAAPNMLGAPAMPPDAAAGTGVVVFAGAPPNAKPPAAAAGVVDAVPVAVGVMLAEELNENMGLDAAPVPVAPVGVVVALALAPKAPKAGEAAAAGAPPKAPPPPPKVGVDAAATGIVVVVGAAPNAGDAWL